MHSRLLTFFKLIKIIFPTRKNMITFSYPRSWQKALHITSLCGCEGMREVFNEIMDNSDCRHEMPTHTIIHRNTGALDQFWLYEKSLLLLLHSSHKDTFVEDIILSYPIWHPLPKFLNHLYFRSHWTFQDRWSWVWIVLSSLHSLVVVSLANHYKHKKYVGQLSWVAAAARPQF